ncbi:MAG: CDP-glycerol glycerophosphotransferase family protein [Candidatus Cloacimonas sp.]|nr:CDP-glycerol glycerophosphotransferase family protein [Candidatus Cloacimonadota bacterium]
MTTFIILTIVFLLSPKNVYAYLDPGSGAVLINLLIAGIAALLFSLKGVFLKLIGKKPKGEIEHKDKDVVLGVLSEGKQYRATFEPIVNALIDHKIPFSYYTLDIEDELLKRESEFMEARFLGYGNLGFAKASNLKASNLICTTPNIGCKGYPIRKSLHINNLIHVFHSINDLSMYRKGSLDHYDSVFMVGDFQAKSIRELEKKRGLKEKKLVSLGLPYLDTYSGEINNTANKKDKKVVLVASSWGSKGLLVNYGTEFIKKLTEANYSVIVRPHPQSYVSEEKFINEIESEIAKLDSVRWDRDISPTKSMIESDLLISDTSSIRFDYAFLCQKPVISLEVPLDAMPGFERDDMSELWMEEAEIKIGLKVAKEDIEKIIGFVEQALNEKGSDEIVTYRESVIKNFGSAGEAIAKYVKQVLIGEKQ